MPKFNDNPTHLEVARRNAGLTRRQLEEKSGVNFRLIENYEQRRRSINNAAYNIVADLAKALGVSTEDIVE